MTESELQEIGAQLCAARMQIPAANRKKFDIEAKDTFDGIRAAKSRGRVTELLNRWQERIQWLARIPANHIAPPCLIRKPGESAEEYLNRCYEIGGF